MADLTTELAELDRKLRWRTGKYSCRGPSGCLGMLIGAGSLLAAIVFAISIADLVNAHDGDPPAGGYVLPAVSFALFLLMLYPAVRLTLHSLSNVPLHERAALKARRDVVRAELAKR